MARKAAGELSNGTPEFEWFEEKRRHVLRERGIDFVEAAKILLEPAFEYRSDRRGETRFVAIGPLPDGTLVAVVYTMRGTKFRIITARRARSNEQRAYIHAVAAASDEGAD
jgi:uncharacterized DUF497 family protein